ncbi:glutathione synthetase [Gloeomargarita lithophora Alchichica-D10]|uniref:Glutathione synthetase n=1 Tax=Gloeomargarita lithophora Alchichica-D10 TaxID=1188229 RepID=A0A1J0ADS8_9CYAN|nr:glutathione synthase [Gloeomargarita lithophora]APB34093.1 glutathione synthetase [Gloeomargarita lithophora Alchichica-D10]
MNFAFIIDPIERLDPGHDSTVAMMEAAQERGHGVWVTRIDRLSVQAGQTWAQLTPVQIQPAVLQQGRYAIPQPWYQLGAPSRQPLGSMQAVFMRQDPPVDTAYLWATYLLDYVPKSTLVVNQPAALRSANEKMVALQFPDLMPPTLVTGDIQEIREFITQYGPGVLKPLGGKAGEGILYLDPADRNLNSLVEISTQGRLPVMVQMYLPQVVQGDKRVVLLAGEPIGAVNRVPKGHEFRGNMAVGGQAVSTEITERDREIAARLQPMLQTAGLYLVGIDIIGGYLTEINVTSPTGIREIDRLSGTQLGQKVIAWVEEKCSKFVSAK